MKVERFITEYASHKKRALLYAYKQYKNVSVLEMVKRIDRAVSLREKGMITADEAIGLIHKL